MSTHDRKTDAPPPAQHAEETPAPPEEWDAPAAAGLIAAMVTRFRGVQHPTVEGQMQHFKFHKAIGQAHARRDLPALRSTLAEFEKWMENESTTAAQFWALERERITAREHALIVSEGQTPEGSITGGHDYFAGDAEPMDPPKRDE